ncbi:hypothetical protein Fleli_2861 [Bernardetia litoralis DSM 6794]|uniref:Lipoprotein n=1 Tax=Bernardetia litoralis (strain ATCC 23117 / DSM 6794 / NBRC 15988 / NCIMB 1366 / Fx l1 / Sio-4) TaxID=880071 RepID=I4AMM9_BERLS|nr:hypothetical protein [Bernardetia litoralis]AFM05214.1 hypothetical protein Fleli_2861 [Bernardetia litoralis DSM 6794]
MKHIFLFLLIILTVLFFISCNKNNQQQEANVFMSEIQTDEKEQMILIEEISNKLSHKIAYFDQYDKIEILFYPKSKRAMGIPGTVCGNLLKNGEFVVDSIQTRVTLSKPQKEELVKFLTSPNKSKLEAADCYWPKHAILFYKSEKVDSFLEICFECNNSCPKWFVLQGRYNDLELLFKDFSSDLVIKNRQH